MINEYLEANKNLNKKIDRLEKENEILYKYKDTFLAIEKRCMLLSKQVFINQKLSRVVGVKNGILYNMQVRKVKDTSSGLYVEIYLD